MPSHRLSKVGAATIAGIMLVLVTATTMRAQAPRVADQKTQPPQAGLPRVAVLDFQCNLQSDDAGRMLAEILAVRLDSRGGVVVVERNELEKVLSERKLKLSGLIGSGDATQVGKLTGANLLVTGRVTSLESGIFAICKGISPGTGQIKGFFLSLPAETPLDDLLDRLDSKLSQAMPQWVEQLTAKPSREAAEAAELGKLLAGKKRPSVVVVISEDDLASSRRLEVPDPAAEIGFKRVLIESGIQPTEISRQAVEVTVGEMREWFRSLQTGRDASRDDDGEDPLLPVQIVTRLAKSFEGTDYLIYGEAFSSDAGELHGLQIAAARVEARIIDLKTGKAIVVDSQSTSAPDLSPLRAGKTALERAGRRLALGMLPPWFEQLPIAEKAQP